MQPASTTAGRRALPRWWWLSLLVILLVAAALRYTGYNFSLPYVDHPDEPNHNIAGRMWIDFGTAKPIGLQGYPPGIITINYVLLRLFHDPATPPSTILWMVRLISITVSLATLVVIALTAARVSTPPGGLVAGALWGVSPLVVEFSRFATPDSYVTCFMLLSSLLALEGTRRDRDSWTTWSIVALMIAIVFKYQAVIILPLVLLLPLWRLRRANAVARRRILRNAAVNVALLGVFAFWLLLIYPTTEASLAPNWAASSDRMGLPSPDTLYQNLRVAADPLGWWNLLLALPSIVFLLASPRPNVWRLEIVWLVLSALAYWAAVSVYGVSEFRQWLPLTGFLTLLIGVGLAGWASIIQVALQRFAPATRWQSVASVVVVIAVLVPTLIPSLSASIAGAYEHTLPDTRNDLARWIDTTLAPAPYIAEIDNHKTLNGAWGGYAGTNTFRRIEGAHVNDRPLETWREMGAVYAIEAQDDYEEWDETPEGRALLEETLLLKTFTRSEAHRGPSMVVLRLSPIQHTASGQLGSIRLIGYDIDRTAVQPGESITFTLYWQADDAPDGDYAVYNHLSPLGSRDLIAQVDGSPLPDERRPTTSWTDDDETFISRPFTLIVPENAQPGDYRMITGFYRRDTGERLPTPDGEDFVLVTTITVE